MKLELTLQERRLLIESLFNQICRADSLYKKNLDHPELAHYYANEREVAELLLGKVKIYL